MIIAFIITLAYASLVTWACIVQYKRCNKLTIITNNTIANMYKISEIILNSDKVLDNPRLKEAFSSDDEVGTFFRGIEQIQDLLNNFNIHAEESQ